LAAQETGDSREGASTEVTKLQAFDKTPKKVSGFVMAC